MHKFPVQKAALAALLTVFSFRAAKAMDGAPSDGGTAVCVEDVAVESRELTHEEQAALQFLKETAAKPASGSFSRLQYLGRTLSFNELHAISLVLNRGSEFLSPAEIVTGLQILSGRDLRRAYQRHAKVFYRVLGRLSGNHPSEEPLFRIFRYARSVALHHTSRLRILLWVESVYGSPARERGFLADPQARFQLEDIFEQLGSRVFLAAPDSNKLFYLTREVIRTVSFRDRYGRERLLAAKLATAAQAYFERIGDRRAGLFEGFASRVEGLPTEPVEFLNLTPLLKETGSN